MSGHGNGHPYHHLPPNAELVEYVDDGDEVYGDVIPVDESQLYYEEGDEIVDVEDVEIVEGDLDVEGGTIYEAPDGTRHIVVQQRAIPGHVQHHHHVQHQHHVQSHPDVLEPEEITEPPQQHSRYRYHTAPQMPRPISGDEYSRSPRINSGPVYKPSSVVSQPTTSSATHTTTSNHVYAIRNGQVFKIDKKTGRASAVRAQIKPSSSSIANQENQVSYASSVHSQQAQHQPPHQPPLDYRKYGANPALTYFAHEQQRTFANAKHAKKSIGSKKPCNCSKSQCLKLYCECFASGEFCMDCNCKDCHNNMDYESERTRAVKATLERNPHAFRPKIGIGKKGPVDIERLHRRGCHCKKSNCLKNYCECYEAKVPCTERCKCCGCRNTEAERAYRDNYRMKASPGLIGLAAAGSMEPRSTSPFSDDEDDAPTPKKPLDPKALKGCPWYYLNDEVIEATATCLLTAVASMQKNNPNDGEIQQAVLNEFSMSLGKVVESAMASIAIDDETFIDEVHGDRVRHTQPMLTKEDMMMDLDDVRTVVE